MSKKSQKQITEERIERGVKISSVEAKRAFMGKLAQRQVFCNGHIIFVGLDGNIGYIKIEDNNLYPDGHSGADRRDAGFNTIMIPLMTRNQLEDVKIAIDEVLKHSK